MNFHRAEFVAAYGTGADLPAPRGPEVAFVGRSNVGKSSLLNRLTYRKQLAKTSASPGKTTTINFFNVDGENLVDLPGYGYASVSQSERRRWRKLMDAYFESDRPIALVIALIDIRHDPSALDVGLLEYLDALELTHLIALTKADKLSRAQALRQQRTIAQALGIAPNETFVTSAGNGAGIDELRTIIADALRPNADQGL